MTTTKVIECISKVLSSSEVRTSIEKRDRHRDFTLDSIYTKVMRREKNDTHVRLLVRVGLDYMQRTADASLREDIMVDVVYLYNRQSGAETYDVLEPKFVRELPDP